MKLAVTVREFARLTTEPLDSSSLDQACIPRSAFDWLCEFAASFSSAGASPVILEGRSRLRWSSYVGVIETPCGTRIEILPKHHDDSTSVAKSRRLLRKMIEAAIDASPKVAGEASIEAFDAPISEWVVGRFLDGLEHLVKRGARFDYLRVESDERFLRGQLDVVRLSARRAGSRHTIPIRHDVFQADRPENRLLRSGLDIACGAASHPRNWRLARELRTLFECVPRSLDVTSDFSRWGQDRLMAHYQPVRPWCELLLRRRSPLSLVGAWDGISLLFPMEQIFERYVERAIRRALRPGARLTAQASRWSLCVHEGMPMFRLQPDFYIEHDDRRWILDAKWKRLDSLARSENYGISQNDIYQLFAYGHKYLNGRGEMALVFPMTEALSGPLPPFHCGPDLMLWVVPFDLERGCLVAPEDSGFPITEWVM